MAMGYEVKAYLGKTNDGCDILVCDNEIEPFRLVRDYDPNEKPGQQWSHTVLACDDINFLAEVILNRKESVSYWKLKEIAEKAISYIYDNDLLDEFLEDRDIDFDEEEMEYFGIEEEED